MFCPTSPNVPVMSLDLAKEDTKMKAYDFSRDCVCVMELFGKAFVKVPQMIELEEKLKKEVLHVKKNHTYHDSCGICGIRSLCYHCHGREV
jgi:phage portal protein BeeE